jgi:tetratricopeptide (TPR) repeat protein
MACGSESECYPGRAATAGASSEAAYAAALHMLHAGQGDPMATIERALRRDPWFADGHCLKAALLVMAAREDARPELAHTLQALRNLPPARLTLRAQRHLEAAQAWLDRKLQKSLRLYGRIVEEDPFDSLALRVAHFGDFQWGRRRELRDRVAAALAHWDESMPFYGHLLAMLSFGHVENGEYDAALAVGHRALRHVPDNAGAIHAIAHVMEMQGKAEEGIRWLRSTQRTWEASPGYAAHLWWHLALRHLDAGQPEEALRIYDDRIAHFGGVAALVDCAGLLWRLDLLGHPLGDRWQRLADRWERVPLGGLRPFMDTHAMLAFAATGRRASARRLMDAMRGYARQSAVLDAVVSASALPMCEALLSFGAGDYARAADQLEALRHLAAGCGGSRAQGDLVSLTLLEANRRSGRLRRARALAAERLVRRPGSRFDQRLYASLSGPADVAATTERRWVAAEDSLPTAA